MNAKEIAQNTLATMLTLILSKEGLVGMLLTIMIASQVYDNYRTTTAQLQHNQIMETISKVISDGIEQDKEEEANRVKVMQELVDALERAVTK